MRPSTERIQAGLKLLAVICLLAAGILIVVNGANAASSGLDAITTMKEMPQEQFKSELSTGVLLIAAGLGTIAAAAAVWINRN